MSNPHFRGFVGLIRQGWHEIPEIMGTICVMLVGVGFGIAGTYNHIKNDTNNRRYKLFPVIMRPDDPRAARVHKD